VREKRFLELNRPGSVLPVVLIVITLLLVMGLGTLRLGVQARVYAARTSSQIAAQVAADAGLVAAIAEINVKAAAMTDCSALTQPGTVCPALSKPTNIPLANSDGTYSYQVIANSVMSVQDLTITVTGKCGLAEKKVSARMTRSGGPFEYAVFTENGMTLKPGTVVDGYNSDVDKTKMNLTVKLGTNSTQSASITMGKDAVIKGDVAVGPGANPADVISAAQATITGSTYALTEKNEMPSVTVPTALALMPVLPAPSKMAVIAASAKYSSLYLGKGETLTVNGPVNLYVTGDVSLSNSAEIKINEKNPMASLTLYLGGNLYLKNGGMLNNTTLDPKRLTVYGLDGCTNVSLDTAAVFYGAMYTPKATVNIKSSMTIYGSLVANGLNQASSSDIHYDASLEDVTPDFYPTNYEIQRWWEE